MLHGYGFDLISKNGNSLTVKIIKKLQKKNCSINNQVTHNFFLFQMNLLIIQNPYEFFRFFVTFLKIVLKILKNKRNVTNFGHVFLKKNPYHREEFWRWFN